MAKMLIFDQRVERMKRANTYVFCHGFIRRALDLNDRVAWRSPCADSRKGLSVIVVAVARCYI
jgi:hypothetical protein